MTHNIRYWKCWYFNYDKSSLWSSIPKVLLSLLTGMFFSCVGMHGIAQLCGWAWNKLNTKWVECPRLSVNTDTQVSIWIYFHHLPQLAKCLPRMNYRTNLPQHTAGWALQTKHVFAINQGLNTSLTSFIQDNLQIQHKIKWHMWQTTRIYHDSVSNGYTIKNDQPLSLLLSTRHDPSGSPAPWQDHDWHEPHHQQQMCWLWQVPRDGTSSGCYSLHIGHECLPFQSLDEPLPSFQCTTHNQHSIITTTLYVMKCWEVQRLTALSLGTKTWQLLK